MPQGYCQGKPPKQSINKKNQVVESDTYTAGEMREMLDYSNDRANEYNNSKITKGEYNNEKILIRY